MIHLGRIAPRFMRGPLGRILELRRKGLRDSILEITGRAGLRRSVSRLRDSYPPQPRASRGPEDREAAIVYLGGRNHVGFLACSLASLLVHWPDCPPQILLDDGSLDRETGDWLETIFPTLTVAYEPELRARLDRVVPEQAFPKLRSLRSRFLMARKLVDLIALPAKRVLYVDSDTLFLSYPAELAGAIEDRNASYFLSDRRDGSYAATPADIRSTCNIDILPRVNAGLFVTTPDTRSLQSLEEWVRHLWRSEPIHFFTEQTLWAMLFSSQNAVRLNTHDYICEPTRDEVTRRTGCFHHYVFPSRHLYYAYAWRGVIDGYLRSKRLRGR